jgi:hypothetical protein
MTPMTEPRQPEKKQGTLTRFVRALKRLVLNKSGEDYTARLAGGEQYWTEALRSSRPGQPSR